ncbi:hypothetical protein Agub_g3816, partial [Astrephomene gubernaculifera]
SPPPQLRRVERCLLHFDIASLDLDQVLRLCSSQHLHSASAAIHNRLHDYKRPLLDMLAAVAGVRQGGSSGSTATGASTAAAGQLVDPRQQHAAVAAADEEEEEGQRRREAGFK